MRMLAPFVLYGNKNKTGDTIKNAKEGAHARMQKTLREPQTAMNSL